MRKKLTLPSGATCVVRPMTAQDFALIAGDLPVLFSEQGRVPENARRDVENGVRLIRISLLAACSPLTMPDGRRLKIVDKEMDCATDAEITIGEISDADAQCIAQEVAELTKLGKEAAGPAKTFPEEQARLGASGSSGSPVSEAAVRTVEAHAG